MEEEFRGRLSKLFSFREEGGKGMRRRGKGRMRRLGKRRMRRLGKRVSMRERAYWGNKGYRCTSRR